MLKDKKTLYAFSLGLPKPNSPFKIRQDAEQKVKRVSVVGSEVDLKRSAAGNTITLQTPRVN